MNSLEMGSGSLAGHWLHYPPSAEHNSPEHCFVGMNKTIRYQGAGITLKIPLHLRLSEHNRMPGVH